MKMFYLIKRIYRIKVTLNAMVTCAAEIDGTTQDQLQIFNVEAKTTMKSYNMAEKVIHMIYFMFLFSSYLN
jgi:hypothetical protein